MTGEDLAVAFVAGWLSGGLAVALYGYLWRRWNGNPGDGMAANVLLLLTVFAWPALLGAWAYRKLRGRA